LRGEDIFSVKDLAKMNFAKSLISIWSSVLWNYAFL